VLFYHNENEGGITGKFMSKNMAISGGVRSPPASGKKNVLCRNMNDYCG
jgi:hypothetical protein